MRIRFGECLLDSETRQLLVAGSSRHLLPRAFRLLHLLLERRPKAISRRELHRLLWPDTRRAPLEDGDEFVLGEVAVQFRCFHGATATRSARRKLSSVGGER